MKTPIKEADIDPAPFKDLTRYCVEMDFDGNVLSFVETQGSPGPATYEEWQHWREKTWRCRCFCWAKDPQHAAKIASEQRAQFIAAGKRGS